MTRHKRIVHRETQIPPGANSIRSLVAFDDRCWVSTRGDEQARSDLGVDTSKLRCSICGAARRSPTWLAMQPPR